MSDLQTTETDKDNAMPALRFEEAIRRELNTITAFYVRQIRHTASQAAVLVRLLQ